MFRTTWRSVPLVPPACGLLLDLAAQNTLSSLSGRTGRAERADVMAVGYAAKRSQRGGEAGGHERRRVPDNPGRRNIVQG